VSYRVFARKYRPETFDQVVGQEHITRTLKNAIEQNRLAHAYIFVGPRGTGKTSTARILAKSLNCQTSPGPTTQPCGTCDSCREIAAGTSLDVLEFDAASNTQVDKVRELIIDNVKYAPTRGRFKMYIVDEVHMLSTSSFNALLKTLEEPPEHVKFFFATTDVQKVPTTILSRCQRFDLKRILPGLISNHLLYIAGVEGIQLATTAAEAIARGAEGGMRDAESMLDQLVAFCGNTIEEADVLTVFGLTAQQTVSDLCGDLLAGDASAALGVVHDQAEAGRDLSRLLSDLITHLRNLLVTRADAGALAGELSEEAVAALAEQAGQVKLETLLELIEQFAAAEQRMKWAPNKKMHFEIAVIRAIQTLGQATLSEVLETLTAMRSGGDPGALSVKPREAAPPRVPRPPVARPVAAAPLPRPAAAQPLPKAEPAPKPEPEPKIAEAEAPAPMPVPAPDADAPPFDLAPVAAAPVAALPAAVPPVAAQPVKPAAPLREAPPRSAPAAGTATPGELWLQLLGEVRRNRPLITGWVESGALLSTDGDIALVGFPPDSSLAAETCQQANNRKFLESVLLEISGRPLTLKCQIREGLQIASPSRPEPEVPKDPMEEFKNDPLIRKALEIFRAEIQPG
jgi:DNA polymerase III subunit gamma/tau